MSVSINGTNGLVFADATTQATAPKVGMVNLIINGAMMIDQRNSGASVTPGAAVYTLDRWQATMSQASKFSVQQNAGSVTPPSGYTNYLGATSTSAYSVLSTESFGIVQRIEGFNCADLGWGTVNAQPVTLSFWIRSSLTGTFGGSLRNSALDRSYPFSYTVSSANAWEQKSITISGDTTGTWLANNGSGIILKFSLGAGSSQSTTAGSWAVGNYDSSTGATSVVGTNGATFYITGVQLEKGSTATSFDYRPYGTELALCQRYYFHSYISGVSPGAASQEESAIYGAVVNNSGNHVAACISYQVPMRSSPTVTLYHPTTGTSGQIGYYGDGTTVYSIATLRGSNKGFTEVVSGGTVTACARFHLVASAEL